MSVKFSNNAKTTLSSAVTSSATSITVADGSVFPSISGSEYFYVTLEDASQNIEIIKVTAVSSNTLTVTRGQESTTARAFASGDKAENRLTAGGLNDVATQADTDTDTTYTAGSGLSLTGTEFANTAPDQTVALTGAGTTTITGTYPNFTITGAGTTYTAGTGITLTGTEFQLTDTNAKLNASAYTAADVLTKIKTVDGTGSGLDADTIDGLEPSALSVSESDRVTGSSFATTGSPSSVLEYQQADSQSDTKLAPNTDWHNTIRMGHGNPYSYYSNTLAMRMTGSGAGSIFTQLISNNTAQGWRQVWDSGNDGSGSGLDADTVDGVHEATFMRRSANSQLDMNNNDIVGVDQIFHEGDADTYMQFHADNQWRVVTGGSERLEVNNTAVTIAGTLNVRTAIDLADNDILRFGSADDVEFFFNGSHFYLDLNSGGNNFYIRDGTTIRYTFNDNGSFTATGNVTAYSDRRLKDDIQPIEGALEKVGTLSGNTYQRNDLLDKDPERRYAGVIAQEVEVVLPEAVSEAEDGTKTVDYNAVIALLVESIKELKAEVEELKGNA